MKGILSEAVPYVCEEERGAPKEEQTVFWIKPKTHHEANQTLSRYAAAGREARGGYRDLHSGKLDSADVAEWLRTVEKIDNFYFPNKFFSDFKGKVEGVNKDKDGAYVEELKEEWIIKEALRYMPAGAVNEIWDVAIDNNKLREGEKKS